MSRNVLAREKRVGGTDLTPDELRQMGVSVLHEHVPAAFVTVLPDAPATQLAQYADASVDLLYFGTIHRFARETAENFLADCFRVLKRFGTVRIATLDLDEIVHAYLFDWSEETGISRTRQLNAALRRPDTLFVYGEEELRDLLRQAGFREVGRFAPGASAHERFWNLETDAAQRLVLEARKP